MSIASEAPIRLQRSYVPQTALARSVGEADQALLEAIGKRAGTTAALFPVAVRGRVVNLMWGDSGATGAARGDLGQLLAFMQRIPRAHLRIIRARVALESRKPAGPQPGANAEEKRNE